MRTIRFLIICFLTLWLSSCATVSNQPTAPTTPTQTWGSRVDTLSGVQDWDMNALIAIRNSQKKTDLTANMQWQQHQKNYTILLFGPLGTGSAKLTGAPGNVTLQTADGKTFNAPTPETLLAQQTNWDLPVSNLYYWIRGLPVPSLPAKKQFDAENRLIDLQQQGWRIQFLNYTSTHQVDLPRKIFIYNTETNVKIIINEWKI
jgi:outer membrane lipoprotein LolB